MPLIPAPVAAPTDRPLDGLADAPPAVRPRLLLVERDAAVGVTLTKALCAYHEVEAVPDGLAAAFATRGTPPDLVIIDLYLPGTDNLTLIRAMRADPRTIGIPIIILTAPAHRELLLRCLSAGASNFLLKPFNVAELLMCVRIELRLRDPLAETSLTPPAFTNP